VLTTQDLEESQKHSDRIAVIDRGKLNAVDKTDVLLRKLGNKRAFSLTLPAAPGLTDGLLHPHKWFGAYLYARKFFEGQLVRASGQRTHLLNHRVQTGFTMDLTSARREYQIEGRACSEEFFVPDGVQGFVSTLVGDVDFASVREVAGAITPVPGGIGPLTNVMLLKQCVQAAWQLAGEKKDFKTAA